MIKHKEDFLSINGVQSVNVEKGIIKFENYFKQLPVPFKIYADFECNLRDVEVYEGSYTKKYHEHVPCSYAYKVVCIDDRFSKSTIIYRDKNAVYEFIKAVLKDYKYCRKIMKKNISINICLWLKKENIYFNKVKIVGFVKNLLIMMMKRLVMSCNWKI